MTAADIRAERPYEGRRVLVTGGSGFIGTAVMRRLVADGATIVATSRQQRPPGDHVAWVRADVRSLEEMQAAIAASRPDVIVHLAAEVQGDRSLEQVLPTLQTNLLGTVNCLVAATGKGIERTVLVGSLLQEPGPGAEPVPPAPYGAAKWAAAGYARMFHAIHGLPAVILRPSMVYGPGQRDLTKFVPYVTTTLLRGEPPLLTSGSWQVDWVYVDDVADAICLAGRTPGIDGMTIDVGSGEVATVRAVGERLARIIGGRVAPAFGARPERPLEGLHVADTAFAREAIGWSARMTLAAGLEHTVAWYRDHPGTPSGAG